MRTWRAWLLVVLLSGCVNTAPVRSTSWMKRLNHGMGDNVVQMDVYLLVRPVGDPFLNDTLWTHTDEMVVDPERRVALEENGLRAGQIVGAVPQTLQELLKSERWCLNPRRRMIPGGTSVPLYLSSPRGQTSFTLQGPGQSGEVSFDQARFALDVTPHPAAHGMTRLQFVPKVEHGEVQLPFKPDPKQAAWVLNVEKPSKTYPHLGFEVTVRPNEVLVIGARLDRPDSLGYRALVDEEGPERGQRVLVLRTASSSRRGDGGEPTLEDLARSTSAPPLALQATFSAVRASGH